MKICFIGKYPPIQGGVSRDNFWAAFALAQNDIQVHLVTNAKEVEYQFRIFEDLQDNSLSIPISKPVSENLSIHYSNLGNFRNYIPWANPFVTKLATIATSVIEQHGCDLIFSYYFEPYAISAYLASQWTSIPFGVRHAGSDVGRLFLSPDLQLSYVKVLQNADYVFASQSTFRKFIGLGVDLEKIYPLVPNSLPSDYFHPSAIPLNVNALIKKLIQKFPKTNYDGVFHRLFNKTFDSSIPTIGIYGKIGETKGSFDLIRALSKLKTDGIEFNFLAVTQGHTKTLLKFVNIIEESNLQDNTWLLPFLPHWQIPNLIRTCTAICFLERDFPIKIHTPTIPREVFACGTCLILSREIAHKQLHKEKLIDGSNVFLVDPLNSDQLASVLRNVIQNPAYSHEVGMNGYREMSYGRENFGAYANRLATAFANINEDVQFRRGFMSIAEMQACLARLYVDDPFRELFYFTPEMALEGYKLSENELNAIKSIDKKMLDFFAASLKNKRQKKFRSAYRFLFQLDEAEINRYYNRYYQLYKAKPSQSTLDQVLEFGEFMEQTLATDNDLPNYASDLARYERLYYQAKFHPTSQDDFSAINDPDDNQLPSLHLDLRPIVREGVYFGAFEHKIVDIVEELRQKRMPEDPKACETHLVFQQVRNSLRPQVFGITAATMELVELCNGNNTVSDLIAEMERKVQRTNLQESVIQIINQLLNMKLLDVNR